MRPLSPCFTSFMPPHHPSVAFGRIGVLLVNIGTPDGTDYKSMRRYLKEFLSDRRIIETPRWIWWFILNGFILTTRPQRKGKDYAAIWNKEKNESPLKTTTRAQTDRLRASFQKGNLGSIAAEKVKITWGMRYGEPSLASALEDLQAQGCDRLLIVPLYPQYAAATTASVCDKIFDILSKKRWQPSLRIVPPWYDDPVYIDALVMSAREALTQASFDPEMILLSFHGIPQICVEKGDPYYCHCAKTARLIREALGQTSDQIKLTFQSRFGPAKWLQPYTDVTIKALAEQGIERLAVMTPGFFTDCLETMEEIGVENAQYFYEKGGKAFFRIPCLNDGPQAIRLLEHVIGRELQGWI